jgi:hypothetical protein
VAEAASPTYVYLTRFQLSDGTVKETRFTTRRQRAEGEILNAPTDAGGTPRVGKGFLWRIRAVEEHEDLAIGAVLVLDFERPHPDQV